MSLIAGDVTRSGALRPALNNPYLTQSSEPQAGGVADLASPQVMHGRE